MVDVTTRNLRIKIPVEFLVYPEWVGGWWCQTSAKQAPCMIAHNMDSQP